MLLNDRGAEVAVGQGPESLIDALNQHSEVITSVYGRNARALLKSASIDTMASGGTPPRWCWYFAPMDNENARVFDPVELLTSSFREKMSADLATSRVGVPLVSSEAPALEQATFALELVTILEL